MKAYRIHIIVLVIGLALLVLIDSLTPKPIDWSMTFSKRDRIPYGSVILYELLPKMFPNAEIVTVQEPPYNVIINDEWYDVNYLFINDGFTPDEYDTEQLLEFVAEGNSVFVATHGINGDLADSLGIETSMRFPHKDSIEVNFVNPLLAASKPYIFRKTATARYFSEFDTASTTILGIASENDPNFIKVDYGEGSFFLNTVPLAFTNYSMLADSNADYVARALSYLPVRTTLWDEYYNVGRDEARTPLRFILSSPALKTAYYLLLASVLLFIIFEGRRRQRIVPVIDLPRNTTLEFVQTVGRLYFQHGDHRNIADKKITYLMEYIRATYGLKAVAMNEEISQRLSDRSGVAIETIHELFEVIGVITVRSSITEDELAQLNTQIEYFYNQTGR